MAEQKDEIFARQEMMEEPPSPKKQKTELGQPDHHHEQQQQVIGAVDLAPSSSSSSSSSSSNPAPVVSSGEEKPQESGLEAEPVEEYPIIGLNPNSKNYARMLQMMNTPTTLADLSMSDDERDNKNLREDTAKLAQGALDYYNDKEGVNYELVDGGLSIPINFHLAMVHHLNFTAKEGSSGSIQRFFAEALIQYAMGYCILDCVKIDTFAPDRVRHGCIYCEKEIYHPPVEHCRYGTNAKDDGERHGERSSSRQLPIP